MRKTYNESEREILIIKLRRIKEIVNIIFEMLLSDIESDYDNEMSIIKNESIKYISEIKSNLFLDEIGKKSDKIIKNIKNKIKYMNIFETYSDNLDFINFIHNRTILDLLEDSYNNILLKAKLLIPDYLNITSNIIIQKNNLFNISKLIICEINKEINEIRLFIKDYISNYKEENLYIILYNLYKINKLFLESSLKFLLDELKRIIKETIPFHLETIKYNYKLGFDYLNDLKHALFDIHDDDTTFVGKGFFNKYMKFIEYFNKYISSIISEDSQIFINLEKNYNAIKNEIFNYLKNKLLAINDYGLETNIYQDNFYFIKQMNEKLLKTFNKINQYFTEEMFTFFKAEVLQLFVNEVQNYNDKKLKEFTDLYEYIFERTSGIYDTDKDYEYQFRRVGRTHRRTSLLDKTTNNIKKINMSYSHLIEYQNKIVPNLISDFNTKLDKYLFVYISKIQTIYSNINSYLKAKINNNNNIEILFKKYKNIFYKLINIDSNNGLFEKLTQINIKEELKYYMETFESNLKLLSENYFHNYYLNNYSLFLEYPEEIQYKINNFNNIINILINYIKQEINSIYRNKIMHIIKSTNNFISNILSSHQKYIQIYLNKNDVIEEYIQSKIKFIKNSFNDCLSQLKNLSKNIDDISTQNNNDFILSKDNYNLPISSLLNKIELFKIDFNITIKNDFNIENCLEVSDTNNYDYLNQNFSDLLIDLSNIIEENSDNVELKYIFCDIALNKGGFKNYEYNYNIIKLRTALNYTKNLIENLIVMADEFKYDEMFDINNFNENENIINDNNIFFIENASLYKLKEINEKSYFLLEDQNEKIIEDILKKYNLNNNEYYSFLLKFKKILNFESDDIKKGITNTINEIINSINILFKKFNDTLYGQKNKYDFYNIKNINIFKEVLTNYYKLIENKFSFNYNQIINLTKTFQLKNVLKNFLSDLQNKKILYFKSKLNEYGKNYNLHSLNITINIGEYFEKYIKRCYEELEFQYIFEYVEIYENFSKVYIDNIINYFNNYKNNVLNDFLILMNKFLVNFKEGISHFVNNEYIIEMKNNYTGCLGYSIDLLNQTLEEDEINYEKYLKYIREIENIDSTYQSDNSMEKIDIDNLYSDNTDLEKIIFFNKTEYLLYCHRNNYFNYSIKIFENFEDNYKSKLNNLINEILIIIENNNLDINFLNNFLGKEFSLNPYNLTQDNILGDYEGFEDMIIYLNFTYNSNYQDYLKKLIIDSFQISYIKYIDNYLLEYLKENLHLFIISKLDFYSKYIVEKVKNEFNYYLFLFNKTKEIGIGTENAFSNLYKKTLNKKINFYYEIVKEDVLFYINIFYRKNKHLFKEKYLNYFIHELNDYNIELYGLKEFKDEFIYDNNLNKTLNNISNYLMKENIISKLNDTFINLYNNKIHEINSLLTNYDKKIAEILININKNEDNLNINKIIMSYQEILDSQNNIFLFRVSDIPFTFIYDFIKNILEPPLIEIKRQYDLIEDEILETISESVNNFPDYTSILKNLLHVDDIFNYIYSLYDIIKSLLIKYGDEVDLDTTNYINKLIHYTYIDGLYTQDEPCIEFYIDLSDNNTKQNLADNEIIYTEKKSRENENRKYDNLTINKNIYLNKLNYYDEDMGGLSKDDVIYILKEIKNTINQLNSTLQINFDTKIKSKLQKYLIKINGTYLFKLKRTVSMAALKFSSFLTKENYLFLESQMLVAYYELENYIFNFSLYLINNTYDLIETIKESSDYWRDVNNYIYDKTLGIYEMLVTIIQNKYTRITNEEKKNYYNDINIRYLEGKVKKHKMFDKIRVENNQITKKVFKVITAKKSEIIGGLIYNCIKRIVSKDQKLITKDDIDLHAGISLTIHDFDFSKPEGIIGSEVCIYLFKLEFPIKIILPSFPYLQFRIIPYLNIDICSAIGVEFQVEKHRNETTCDLIIDISLGAIAAINLEIGLYFPPEPTGIELSFAIGIKGILGAGRIGLKLSFDLLNKGNFTAITYYKYEALQFYFYILFKLEIKMKIFKFSFEFYLCNERILSGCKNCSRYKEKEIK